jgi:hypothetical protein
LQLVAVFLRKFAAPDFVKSNSSRDPSLLDKSLAVPIGIPIKGRKNNHSVFMKVLGLALVAVLGVMAFMAMAAYATEKPLFQAPKGKLTASST